METRRPVWRRLPLPVVIAESGGANAVDCSGRGSVTGNPLRQSGDLWASSNDLASRGATWG
jgi:hypothetical protein